MPELQKFWFTFGADHVTEKGDSLSNHFTVIRAFDEWQARAFMIVARGRKWAFTYTENGGEKSGPAVVQRWNSKYIHFRKTFLRPETIARNDKDHS